MNEYADDDASNDNVFSMTPTMTNDKDSWSMTTTTDNQDDHQDDDMMTTTTTMKESSVVKSGPQAHVNVK